MAFTDAERAELGRLIQRERERKFNTKKAAYTAAVVNAGTWDKAEAGESVRPDRLRLIVRCLWPASEGDWGVVLDAARTAETAAASVVDPGDREKARRAIEHLNINAAMRQRLLEVIDGSA